MPTPTTSPDILVSSNNEVEVNASTSSSVNEDAALSDVSTVLPPVVEAEPDDSYVVAWSNDEVEPNDGSYHGPSGVGIGSALYNPARTDLHELPLSRQVPAPEV